MTSDPPRALRAALSALGLVALLAACSSTPLDTPNGAPVENRDLNARPATGTGSASGGQSRVAPVDIPDAQANDAMARDRVVYFDFDSYAVKDEYRPIVDRFGKMLAGDRGKRVQVEGHTDERGGREYNLALGQKRAEAVAKALTLLGASASQVEAVSFGKERPAVQGGDEAAYAKNRRAEINAR